MGEGPHFLNNIFYGLAGADEKLVLIHEANISPNFQSTRHLHFAFRQGTRHSRSQSEKAIRIQGWFEKKNTRNFNILHSITLI